MSELSLVLPEIGKPDTTEDPKIVTAFTAIQTFANGNIGGVNVEDELTGLRLIQRTDCLFKAKEAAGTYIPSLSSYQKMTANTASFSGPPPNWFLLAPADYSISGKETQLAIKADIATNAVTPAATFTFGVYPVEQYLGAEAEFKIKYTAVLAGSTVALTPGAANNESTGLRLTMPATKYVSVGFATSAETAEKSMTAMSISLFAANA